MKSCFSLLLFFLLTYSEAICQARAGRNRKPVDVEEAVVRLSGLHHDTTKLQIRAMSEDQFVGRSHLSLGMWMRNNWGLWRGGRLSSYFNSHGIYHPDDMSGVILRAYYRSLQGRDVALDSLLATTRDAERAAREHHTRLRHDTAYQRRQRLRTDSLHEAQLVRMQSLWLPGKSVEGYLDHRCGLFGGGDRTIVGGSVVGWEKDTLLIRIGDYGDVRRRKRVRKCNAVVHDILRLPVRSIYGVSLQGWKLLQE